MFRRFVASTLFATALAGVVLVPSIAEARPVALFCVYPDGGPDGEPWRDIRIGAGEEAASVRETASICRAQGGHPGGVVNG